MRAHCVICGLDMGEVVVTENDAQIAQKRLCRKCSLYEEEKTNRIKAEKEEK